MRVRPDGVEDELTAASLPVALDDPATTALVEVGAGRRRTVVGLVAAAALLGAGLVASRDGGGSAASATTTTATTTPAPTTTAVPVPTSRVRVLPTAPTVPADANFPDVVQSRATAVPGTGGLVLWTVGDAGLRGVVLATGSAVDLPVGDGPAGDPAFRPAGGTLTVVPGGVGYTAAGAQWFVPADGGTPVRVATESGFLAPGPTDDEVLVVRFLADGARVSQWNRVTGATTGDERVPIGSYPVGGAEGAVVLASSAGGTYLWRPGEPARRISPDLAIGAPVWGRVPVRTCDERLRCTHALLDVADGTSVPLPPPDAPVASVYPSPLGGWVIETTADRGLLVARGPEGDRVVLDPSPQGTAPVWSPDGDWAAWADGEDVQLWRVGTESPAVVFRLEGVRANGLVLVDGAPSPTRPGA